MAFFENVGKKISATGQSAMNKAKEVAEISKINSMISDEETRINTNFYQIGKTYLNLHADDYEPQFAPMIQEIEASQKKVSDYKSQIQDIKGIILCEKCGAEVSKDSAFCNSCGAPLPKRVKITNENVTICNACGKAVKKGMKFCVSCGAPISDLKMDTDQKQEPVEMKYKICPSCGTKSTDMDDMFCDNCGTKLVQLSDDRIKDETTVNPQNDTEEALQKSFELRCPKCGFINNDPEVLFCVECGTKLV